jgi:hypothetical protein
MYNHATSFTFLYDSRIYLLLTRKMTAIETTILYIFFEDVTGGGSAPSE